MFFLSTIFFSGCLGYFLEKEPFFKYEDKLQFFHWFIQACYTSLMGIRVYSQHPSSEIANNNYLMISNHLGFTDFLTLLVFHFRYFSTHRPIFILKRSFREFPFFGKYFNMSPHIPVQSKMSEKELEKIQDYLKKQSTPFVLYLFPEGDLSSPKNLKREKDPKYHHLLNPKTKGFQWVYPCVDHVFDVTLLYNGDQGHEKQKLLLGKYPSSALILSKDVTQQFKTTDTDTLFDQLWQKKDKLTDLLIAERNDLVRRPPWWLLISRHMFVFYSCFWVLKNIWGVLIASVYLIFLIEKEYWNRHENICLFMLTGIIVYVFSFLVL